MEALRDAFMRADHALQCDERQEFQEAYKGYLATTAFIMNVLGQRATTSHWCDDTSRRMLDLAKQCIEAASVVGQSAVSAAPLTTQRPAPHPTLQKSPQTAPIPAASIHPVPQPASLSSLHPAPQPTSLQPDPQPSSLPQPLTPLPPSQQPVYTEDLDIFSILDSLPDIPINKPGKKFKSMKRSSSKPPDWVPPDESTLDTPDWASGLPTVGTAEHENQDESASLPNIPGPSPEPTVPLPPAQSLPSAQSLPPTLPPSSLSQPGAALQQIPRSSTLPATGRHQEVRKENSYHSSLPYNSLGRNIGDKPVFLNVTPMDRAIRDNEILAAKYERRAQRGMARPSNRLELVRAQQENIMLAKELAKTIERKSAQRKLRLEQEEYGNFGAIGTFEAILTSSAGHLESLYTEIRSYDHMNGWVPAVWLSVLDEEEQMRQFVARCLREPEHPLYKALGEAQFNTYNRLGPLNKKIYGVIEIDQYEALYPGIEVELQNITTDITMYIERLTAVFRTAYPKFNCEIGLEILNEELTKVFFQPVWERLVGLYSFLSRDTEAHLKQYFNQHSNDTIHQFDIQDRYKLGNNAYSSVMDVVREVPNTTSPLNKLSTLVGLGEQITHCIKEYYNSQGMSEVEAAEIACLGADDMIPICIYVVVKSNVSNLLAEINCLEEIVPDQYLLGAEGYFLMTIRAALFHIAEKVKASQKEEEEVNQAVSEGELRDENEGNVKPEDIDIST